MKLWILKAKEELPIDHHDEYGHNPDNPWDPWYDKTFGFVIRAENEVEARKLAAKKSNGEGKEAWLNPKFSTCIELTPEGQPEVLLNDTHDA